MDWIDPSLSLMLGETDGCLSDFSLSEGEGKQATVQISPPTLTGTDSQLGCIATEEEGDWWRTDDIQ